MKGSGFRGFELEIFHQIYAIGVKELLLLYKDRSALAMLFLMPAFFILVMSFALETVFEAGSRERPVRILVVNEDRGPWARDLIEEIERTGHLAPVLTVKGAAPTRETAERLIAEQAFSFALFFGEHFSESLGYPSPGAPEAETSVALICDPAVNRQLLASVKGMVQGALYQRRLMVRLPDMIRELLPAEHGAGFSFSQGGGQGLDDESVLPQLKPSLDRLGAFELPTVWPHAMQPVRRPTSTEQNVPGYTIFGVFFIVLTLASGFIREKSEGTFQRILSAPVPRAVILTGKLLPFYCVNLIQIVIMFLIGVIVFDMRLGNPAALVLVSLALAGTANGLGLLVAAVCRTEAQVNGLSVLLAITLSALGGMMVPVFLMPGAMKTLSCFTPHAWALSGYQDVIVRGLGLRAVLPETALLVLFAAVFFAIALWRFRFNT